MEIKLLKQNISLLEKDLSEILEKFCKENSVEKSNLKIDFPFHPSTQENEIRVTVSIWS